MAINHNDKFRGEIFNVGLSNANISKIELCQEIKKVIKDFVFQEADLGSDPDKRNYIVSNKKIESIGFVPTTTLQEGIVELAKGLQMFNHRPFTNI